MKKRFAPRKLGRKLKWLFFNSGAVALGFEHFLAMFPSTILVPLMINREVGVTVVDVSLVLLTSGIGTFLFNLISRRKIPAYLGSSFAYIGLTVYLIETLTSENVTPQMAYAYVGWAYVFSAAVLIALSFLYKIKGIDKFMSKWLPATVVGPAISLIGLELADTAMSDSGFSADGVVDPNAAIVALITLSVIILFSLIKHRVLKNAAIIIGMVVGFAVYVALEGFPDLGDSVSIITIPEFSLPLLTVPDNLPGLFIAVLPATFIVFTENIGRVTVINRMANNEQNETAIYNSESVKTFEKALFSHGVASFIATLFGSVPNTMYAENIAVMSIHRSRKKNEPDPFIRSLTNQFSCAPYFIAACFAILASFFGHLQVLLLNIPKPVIGGMELFLFGIISAPGIQLLVEQRVDYKKMSNQLITASVLITGVSGLEINFGGIFELKGMGLGFVVGVVLNIIVRVLKRIGNISDTISFGELFIECLTALHHSGSRMEVLEIRTNMVSDKSDAVSPDKSEDSSDKASRFRYLPISDLYRTLVENQSHMQIGNTEYSNDFMLDIINHATTATIGFRAADGAGSADETVIRIHKTANGLYVVFEKGTLYAENVSDAKNYEPGEQPYSEQVQEYLNDYPDAIDDDGGTLQIDVEKNIPMNIIKELTSCCHSCKLS